MLLPHLSGDWVFLGPISNPISGAALEHHHRQWCLEPKCSPAVGQQHRWWRTALFGVELCPPKFVYLSPDLQGPGM